MIESLSLERGGQTTEAVHKEVNQRSTLREDAGPPELDRGILYTYTKASSILRDMFAKDKC